MMTKVISVSVFWERVTRRILCRIHFPKLSDVEDKLKIIGFFGLMPKTFSFGERPIFVLTRELKT